jgi:minor extracellular serine protease Vpr
MKSTTSMQRRTIHRLTLLCAAALLAACGSGQDAAQPASGAVPQSSRQADAAKAASRLLPQDQQVARVLDPRLKNAKGPVEVWVSLDQPAVAAAQAARAAQMGIAEGEVHRMQRASSARDTGAAKAAGAGESTAVQSLRAEAKAQREKVGSQQASFASSMAGLGAVELGRVRLAHNAVAIKIDAASLPALAQMSGVTRVRPVIHYKLNLAETVPYVGGAALQQSGFDGTGTTVAIIDSGIDYTHRNLGGPGTTAAYAEAAGAGPADPKAVAKNALFPSAKVTGGFDFVGDAWPNGGRSEDPNPIDYWFHGTHVADIVGGASVDGKHKGMAPGAKLLAVKACSSVSSSCNGIALLKAMDYALDPNGDGDLSDAVDVINLSLGSDYGQPEDDLSFAVGNAVSLGVVVVASAGNGGNLPTIVGSPSIEPGAISVAQTEVPSAKTEILIINSPASIARRITEVGTADFAPVTGPLSGDVVFVGRGCPADAATSRPEDPYLANPSGKIALIDRGVCDFSGKMDRAARAGAKAVLIGLIAPGPALGILKGSGSQFVPTLVITQPDSNLIKAELAKPAVVSVTLDLASARGGVRFSSARGPSNGTNLIKPEIGAPGASVSADVGTGAGETPFGGTSGAAPMVAGAAAQLLQAFPNRTPMQIKAMLMNTANTEVFNAPIAEPGVLAPISRIGSGELRVDRAAQADFIAWNPKQKSAALSFGYHSVAIAGAYVETLKITNFSNAQKTIRLDVDFRYADDKASGAVRVIVPPAVGVPANGSVSIPVLVTVDPRKLPDWAQDGSDIGASGATFAKNEFDGYVTLQDGDKKVSVPWHILPRKASAVFVGGGGSPNAPIGLFNIGAQQSVSEIFALTGTSGRVPADQLPQPGSNLSFTDLRAVGARLAEPGVIQFGISTFGRRSNPLYPAGYFVDIDVNRDGKPEFQVFNAELLPDSGISAVFVFDYATNLSTAYAFIDADFYSGNMILTAPLAAMGLTDSSTFDFTVVSYDNYFTGQNSDFIGPMTFTPDKPKFKIDGAISRTLGTGQSLVLRPQQVAGGATASPSQKGILLLHRGNEGSESSSIVLQR